jgi:hypothetical protein
MTQCLTNHRRPCTDAQAVAELHKEVSGLREMRHAHDDLKHLAEDLAQQVAALKAQVRALTTDLGVRYNRFVDACPAVYAATLKPSPQAPLYVRLSSNLHRCEWSIHGPFVDLLCSPL